MSAFGKRTLRQENLNLEGALFDNTPPPMRLAPVRLSAAPQKVNAGKKIAESAAAALRASVAAAETAASAAAKSAAEAKESAEMAHQEVERVVTTKNKTSKNEKDNNFQKLENVIRSAKSAAEAKESAEMAHQEAERAVTTKKKNKTCKNEKYVYLDEKDNNFQKLENVIRSAKSAAEAKESAEMAHQEAEKVVTTKNKTCKNEKYVYLDEKDENFQKLENVSRSLELVKFFVSTYDTPNILILPSANGYEGTLLTLALQNNFKGVNINSEIVKYLINEGVDTSYKEQIRKNTALHYAAIAEIPQINPPSNPNLECVKLILTCPQTNLFAENAEGFTPRKLLTNMLDRGTRINRNQKEHVEVENFLIGLEKQRGGRKGTRHIRKNKNKNKNKKSRKYTRRN